MFPLSDGVLNGPHVGPGGVVTVNTGQGHLFVVHLRDGLLNVICKVKVSEVRVKVTEVRVKVTEVRVKVKVTGQGKDQVKNHKQGAHAFSEMKIRP